MAKVHAAVVTPFDEPPHYQPFDLPAPAAGEVLVEILAAGLHPRVRSGAAGSHYTSSGTLPMIPGIDGVGRLPDGKLVYFASDNDVLGTMADKALIDPRRSVELPAGADVARVAAAMNPAMSSWVALRRRVTAPAGPERPDPRRDRQRRDDGRAGGQATRRGPGRRRRPRPGAGCGRCSRSAPTTWSS